MGDLSQQVIPVLMMNGPGRRSSKDGGMGGLKMGADGRISPNLEAGSRLSSKRRSSFGSDDAMALAENMTNRNQGMGKATGASQIFNQMGLEVIMRAGEKQEHPLLSKNLRELVMVFKDSYFKSALL